MQSELLLAVQQATLDRRSLEKQLGALRATIPRRMSLKDIHAAISGGRP